MSRNSFCSYCGTRFREGSFPKTCLNCSETTYINPLPVTVMFVPVDKGVVLIRRGIEPHIGKLALPGGFVDMGESWQEAGAREVKEETGITVDPEKIRLLHVESTPEKRHILIFGVSEPITIGQIPPFDSKEEIQARLIVQRPEDLAFPLHTKALKLFFEMQDNLL